MKINITGWTLDKIFPARLTWFNVSYSLLFSAGLAVVLNLGPMLQQTTLSILTGPEVEIYRSAYGSSLIKFTELSDWLWNFGLALMAPIALGIMFFLRQQRKARDVFLISSVYFFCALSALDFVFLLTSDEPHRVADFSASVISNLVGSPLLAAYVVITGRLGEIVLRVTPNLLRLRKALALVTAGLAGVVVSACFHQVYSFFFDPKQIKIQAVSQTPFDGYYAWEGPPGALATENEEQGAGFFLRKTPIEKPTTLFLRNATIEWSRGATETKYKADFYVYSGCGPGLIPPNMKKEMPAVSVTDLTDLRISLGERLLQISVPEDDSNTVLVENKSNTSFWMSKPKDDKGVTFAQSSKPTSVTLGNEKGRVELVSFFALLDTNEQGIVPATKEHQVSVLINGKARDIILRNKRKLDPNAEVRCMSARSNRQAAERMEFNEIALGALLRLVISPVSASSQGFSSPRTSVGVTSADVSFLRIDDVSNDELSTYFTEGKVSEFAIRGRFQELKLNDQKTEIGPVEELSLSKTSIKARIKPTGELFFDGIAQAAYRNSERMNQTRWERLDASVKLLLLSGMFGLISTSFVFLSKTLTSNRRIRI